MWLAIDRLIGNCLAMKLMAPAKPSAVPPVATSGIDAVQPGQVNPFLLPPTQAYPAWKLGQPLSMHVYFSTSPNGDVFSRQWTSAWREDQDAGLPNFVWENITFGDWKDIRIATYDLDLPLVSCLTIFIGTCIEICPVCAKERILMGGYFPCQKWHESTTLKSFF